MPLFQHPSGQTLFYSHVPKTAGSYIEALLTANGLTRKFWNPRPWDWGLRISPQHWHRTVFESVIDFDAVDLGFISVRHPVDRLISEYRWRVKRNEAGSGFGGWLRETGAAFGRDASLLDNHLRPQLDFYHPALEVHRQELGFGASWAKALGFRAQIPFRTLEVERRLQTKGRVDVTLSADDLKRAVAFCETHYAQDFEFFDYDPDGSEEIAGKRDGRPVGLRHGCFPEAVIAPADRIAAEQTRPGLARGIRGGVYDREARVISSAGLVRNNEKLVHEARITARDSRDERVIFAGYNFSHFGHFLIESLARLWYLDAVPDDRARIVWAKIGMANGASRFLPWQKEIFEILKIENPVEMIDRPVRYREVVVPRASVEFPNAFDPAQGRFFERTGIDCRPVPGRRIWLSRSKLEGKGSTVGIEGAEAKLAAGGWSIVHPQELPMREQIGLLAEAERVAGEEGSALHLLLFVAKAEALRVDIVPRFETLAQTYWQIAEAKGFRQHEIDMGAARTKALKGRKADKAYASFEPLFDALL